jgi:sulfate adenylyltransferase
LTISCDAAMADESSQVEQRSRCGLAILITGLPAAGKTTLGAALTAELSGRFGREVTLLDGDEVRKLLSSELGFSREHRRLNVLRHGYIAAEIAKHGGIAICSLIAPYEADRAEMRGMVVRWGSFVEIHLSTPLAECMRRDPKGLYARARAGELKHMTGIDDPYEPPPRPDLKLDGARLTVAETVAAVTAFLLDSRLLSCG